MLCFEVVACERGHGCYFQPDWYSSERPPTQLASVDAVARASRHSHCVRRIRPSQEVSLPLRLRASVRCVEQTPLRRCAPGRSYVLDTQLPLPTCTEGRHRNDDARGHRARPVVPAARLSARGRRSTSCPLILSASQCSDFTQPGPFRGSSHSLTARSRRTSPAFALRSFISGSSFRPTRRCRSSSVNCSAIAASETLAAGP